MEYEIRIRSMEHISNILTRHPIAREAMIRKAADMKVHADSPMYPYARIYRTLYDYHEKYLNITDFDEAYNEVTKMSDSFEKDMKMAVLKELDRVNR